MPAPAAARPLDTAARGLMFHHFHDGERHLPGQGSISAEELRRIIELVGVGHIVPAEEWQRRALAGELGDEDVCLTFDDNLRCQYDIALPVLRELGLTAFWFVPTSVLQGHLLRLELYRVFRVRFFESMDAFYEAFFGALRGGPLGGRVEQALRGFDAAEHLAEFPFYSEADRRFRFVRDQVLGPERYQELMDELIRARGVRLSELARGVWMDDGCLCELDRLGHVIGLHSHTHPTRLADLNRSAQQREYRANQTYLAHLLGRAPTVVSHPCNSYNDMTLRILSDLGVTLGFRANTAQQRFTALEMPREDHANLLARLK